MISQHIHHRFCGFDRTVFGEVYLKHFTYYAIQYYIYVYVKSSTKFFTKMHGENRDWAETSFLNFCSADL